ncbi:MAG: hypothetical protein AAB955_00905 [Patescibacteria group bacterium]
MAAEAGAIPTNYEMEDTYDIMYSLGMLFISAVMGNATFPETGDAVMTFAGNVGLKTAPFIPALTLGYLVYSFWSNRAEKADTKKKV